MTKYTYAEIEGLWIRNGGSAVEAPLMAAIALAESGGDSNSLNDNPGTGDYSVGLWQINYFNGLRAERVGLFGSPEALRTNPDAQARAAVYLRQHQGLGAWTTYTSGAYKRFMSNSTTPTIPNTGGMDMPVNAGEAEATCAWKIQKPSVGPFGGGDMCVVSKVQVRAIIGGILITGAVVVGVAGVVILMAYGLSRTSAGRAVTSSARAVPGVSTVVKGAQA